MNPPSSRPSSLRNQFMMAFLFVIISWGVILTVVIDASFTSIVTHEGLPAAVAAKITSRFLLISTSMTLVGLVLFYFIARYLSNQLCAPVLALTAGAELIGHGNLATRVSVTREDELGELAQAFNRMAEQLGELDRLKSGFVATVSHELRTPLASIVGYSELLLDPDLPVELRQDSIQVIHQKSLVLDHLIEGLLDLNRLEEGKLGNLDLSRFDLIPLLEERIANYRAEDHRHQFLFTTYVSTLLIEGDQLRLERVVDNLLSNAVKYSPKGGTVALVCEQLGREVVLRVHDEGIGMTPEQLQHVFERFYRADSTNTAIRGVGLGLTIVRQVVESHNGRIRIESLAGEGTTVTVTLPLVQTQVSDSFINS